MTTPLPETAKQAVEQLTGPRYRPGAYPLLALAKDAIHGHQMITEKVREHAALVAQEIAAQRTGRGAEKDADGTVTPGGS